MAKKKRKPKKFSAVDQVKAMARAQIGTPPAGQNAGVRAGMKVLGGNGTRPVCNFRSSSDIGSTASVLATPEQVRNGEAYSFVICRGVYCLGMSGRI
jgi:hypothetical protein